MGDGAVTSAAGVTPAPGRPPAAPERGPAASPATVVVLAIGLLLLFALTTMLESTARTWTANVGSFLLAAAAGFACARASRRTDGRQRRAWTALTVALWSWAAGQLTWTILESGLGDDVPFPTVADIGYLGFPVAALVGLYLMAPSPANRLSAPRRVLDASMVGCAFTLLAWTTLVEPITAGYGGSTLDVAVALAYPSTDVVLLTVTVLTAALGGAGTRQWLLLGAGMLAMVASDSAFLYLTATEQYASGGAADWGWWTAFCLLGTAGALARPARVDEEREEPRWSPVRAGLLPYLPLVAAGGAAAVKVSITGALDATGAAMFAAMVALLLARQYATLRENQQLASTIHHMAFNDALTGLANRALFNDRVQHAVEMAARESRPVSVVFLDLDDFKVVNDSFGHRVGDGVLVAVATRLRGAVDASDTVARLGGDEFAVLVESGADALVVGHALLRALEPPVELDGRSFSISASVGVSTTGHGHTRPSDLLLHADNAMYSVKRAGKRAVRSSGPISVAAGGFDVTRPLPGPPSGPGMREALRRAVHSGAMQVLFQPIVATRTAEIEGVEALVRWQHDGTDVPAEEFVPICEQDGLSPALTALVLQRACRQLAAWNRMVGHQRLRMAVNIGVVEFRDPTLVSRVLGTLAEHRVAAGQLELEITERTTTQGFGQALDTLVRLSEAGVRLVLDDFGIGYSSLARLADVPLAKVKIDRRFLAEIDRNPRQLHFLDGLLDLVRHLGLRAVAEGVEREQQLAHLNRLGCDAVQGYLLQAPETGSALTPLVVAGRLPAPVADLLRRTVTLPR